ncbi:uncharacterized protein BDR25DRAFT_371009 [Lindgomyces ingoldianus]|uniref:Uncharacterized protein n=1 Tax=Lindgomyces ingoldianus TaxID=673940 RepID=A0ACB6RCV6_9PLEO|nr:uncharacterized protein BDR25DRAFT_371009 [Lindgomyces ingoldianus]KAF2477074.1 hypothetical protein BDR25DRAFT_371009 [Lindgomyces ingoldianus]
MPTYRGINIDLHSQFDINTLPEYYPKPQDYYTNLGISATVPRLVEEETSTCSVYIPVLPSSQFWIGYSILPPVPEDQHFLFKLYINNVHIVSWSCGREEKWKGKTMFGLYERGEGEDGKKRIEKRALCFTAVDRQDGEWKDVVDPFDPDARVEIQVFRASGRKRIPRETKEFARNTGAHGRGIELVNAGRASGDHPKRFYKFALIDPVDRPFVAFRFFYRTWEQIRDLGLLGESDESEQSLVQLDGQKDGMGSSQMFVPMEGEVDVNETDGVRRTRSNGVTDPLNVGHYIPTGAPGSDDGSRKRHSGAGTPPHFYSRLSVPPSVRLSPPKPSANIAWIPRKSESTTSTSYRPHPAYPVEDWTVRTPSPVKSIREGISTPPLGRRRGLTASGLMSVVSNALKRRGTPSSEYSTDAGSRMG